MCSILSVACGCSLESCCTCVLQARSGEDDSSDGSSDGDNDGSHAHHERGVFSTDPMPISSATRPAERHRPKQGADNNVVVMKCVICKKTSAQVFV